jgi:hypothetical protein
MYCALVVCFIAAPALAAAVKAGNFEKAIGSGDCLSTESVQIVSTAPNATVLQDPLTVDSYELTVILSRLKLTMQE